ncbi:TPA: hypothetical protein ACH3X3_009034 [Trebouxia sp. C0006]
MAGKGPIAAVQFYDASDSCPFAAKAWLTLLEKGIKFQRHTIDLKDKPKYFSDLYASINPDPTARAKVPLLIDGDERIVESNLVAEYLDNTFPESGPKLFPTDPLKLFKVRCVGLWRCSLTSFPPVYSSCSKLIQRLLLRRPSKRLTRASR